MSHKEKYQGEQIIATEFCKEKQSFAHHAMCGAKTKYTLHCPIMV